MANKCPQCGASNGAGARFCNQCSAPLLRACPFCGNSHPVAARFCNETGQALPPLAPAAPAAPPATGLLAPQSLIAGRYLVVRKLGQGGMGAVYLAADQRLGGKQVALKEMSDAALTDPAERQAARAAFEQEAQMLANLDHANLPKVSDYFSENGNLFLVMEFVAGDTLADRLARAGRPLPEPFVRAVTDQLCDVLGYLHSRQPPIIFRDLKPGNIMVLPGDRVKLIDFGIARHFKAGKRQDTQVMGTPGFAAPEQHGRGQSDARTDVYALGVTMHHLLTGYDPGSTPFKLPPARALNPLLSGSVEAAIATAVEVDPDRRWQSAADLRRALQGPAGAPLPSPAGRPAPTVAAGNPLTSLSGAGAPAPLSPRMATPGALAPALPPTMATPALPAPPAYPSGGVPYVPLPGGLGFATDFAGYGQRVTAYLIDAVLMAVFVGVGLGIGGSMMGAGSPADVLGTIVVGVAVLGVPIYFLVQTARGQTPGKKAMKIRIVDAYENPPGMGRAVGRYFGFFLEGLAMYLFFAGILGWLWPLWDANKQAWHDKVAGTYVIKE